MKNKNNFYIVASISVVLLAGLYLFNQDKIAKPAIEQVKNNNKELPAPEIPKFVVGSVSKVEGNKVFINVGNEEKIIVTDESTEITKQMKEGIELRSLSAKFSDIKSPVQIIIYYISNSSSEYKASKIHILQ